jgi:5'-nucleotidase
MRKALLALGVMATAIVLAPIAGARVDAAAGTQAEPADLELQVLALNDFHGNLRPPEGSGGRIGGAEPEGNAGGVEYLATTVRDLRATNPNTLFVSAGDLIGATPLISAAFHDEPTIEAFNLMGLDFNGVGNHEFDEGVGELLRMQYGNQPRGYRYFGRTNGCHPVDGCGDGTPFEGANFDFLAANVRYRSSGETIFPPYQIRNLAQGLKVAIIGMTLEATPTIVTQSAVQDINFFDEADSVNALIPQLKEQGVETIIVLLHEGGNSSGGITPTTINQCNSPTGPVLDVVDRMDSEVDVVVTGHTNWAVNCVRPDGKVMTGAASFGRLVTDIDLTINAQTKDVDRSKTLVNNVIVKRTIPKAADLTALVSKWGTLAAPTENRVVGGTNMLLTRTANAAGESQLGEIIADAQLAAAKLYPGGADVAFMNAGGIRADINIGEITYGEAFNVQPFANILVTMDMTGQQIVDVLQQQFTITPPNTLLGNGILQIGSSLTYTRTSAGATGQAGDLLSEVKVNGSPIDLGATYRVALNNFLADGGDNFTVFRQGTNRFFGEIDLDAFATWLTANNPVPAPPMNRITLGP